MGVVLWHAKVSLDGFIAGKDHALGWAALGSHHMHDEVADIKATGAVVIGRKSFDVGKSYRKSGDVIPHLGGWNGPTFVVSHDIDAHELHPAVSFVGGVEDAVAQATKAAGDANTTILGSNIGVQCLGNELVDEIVVQIVPVILGDGVRLVKRLGDASGLHQQIDLELLETRQLGSRTDLRYRVLR